MTDRDQPASGFVPMNVAPCAGWAEPVHPCRRRRRVGRRLARRPELDDPLRRSARRRGVLGGRRSRGVRSERWRGARPPPLPRCRRRARRGSPPGGRCSSPSGRAPTASVVGAATRTELADGERAMRCPSCGLLAFPRVAPAMIVLVTRGEDGPDQEALLARGVELAADDALVPRRLRRAGRVARRCCRPRGA